MIACSTAVRCGSPLEKALADISAAGFQKIDLLTIDGWVHVNSSDLANNWDAAVSNLDGLLAKYALTPVALNTGVGPQLWNRSDEANAKRLAETAGLIRLMGHHGIKIAAIQPRNGDSSRLWEDVLKDCVATLREQIGAGETSGVQFALELHVRSPFETFDQARRLLEEFPDVPLVYDPTHFVMQDIPIKETGWLMANAKHCHLRDAANGKMQMPFGEGAVDFDWILSSMRDAGYTGGFSMEYLETGDFNVMDSSRRLYEKIAEYFPG